MIHQRLSIVVGLILAGSIALADSPRGVVTAMFPSAQKTVTAEPLKGQPLTPAKVSGIHPLTSVSWVPQGSLFVVIDNINFYITSTSGSILVSSNWASQTHIPISQLWADPSVGYFVEKSDVPTALR